MVLFMDASDDTLRHRKENDLTRTRNFFEYHLKNLLPLKRQWFIGRDDVDVLTVDGLDAEQVGRKVREWCDNRMARTKV